MKRTTIAALVFWIIFIGSFGLYRRFPLVDTVWVVVGRLSILALAIFALIKACRDHEKAGRLTYQGLPRWLERFLMDEEESRPPDHDKPDSGSHNSTQQGRK